MSLLKFFRSLYYIGTAISLLGDLLVRIGTPSVPPNLGGTGGTDTGDLRHSQDPLTHGVENEKPESDLQREFDFGNDSIESDPHR